MSHYRKKPIVIEAMQYRGPQDVLINRPGFRGVDYALAFDDWINSNPNGIQCIYRGDKFIIQTLEGEMEAIPGDFIIRGVKGEIYPCKPDIFEATYEPITPTQAD